MGAFNILIAEVDCPSCKRKHENRIQFKFGNTWQLRYKIGDVITWGGNDIGKPDITKVKAYGIAESTICPFCGVDNIPEEYDIFIEKDVIMGFSAIENRKDYLEDDGAYVILAN